MNIFNFAFNLTFYVQIWALVLCDSVWWKGEAKSAGDFFVVAGNGREENRNNSYPLKSGFAQVKQKSIIQGTIKLALRN